jgi:hypothetical protein
LGKLKQENERLRKSHNPTGKPPQPHPKPKKEKIMNKAISQAMKTALESFQKEKATYEFDLAQLRSRVRELESTNRIKQEHVTHSFMIMCVYSPSHNIGLFTESFTSTT